VWIAYLDESAEDERKFMSVAALLCPEGQVQTVTQALDSVVSYSERKYGTSPDAEIHAMDILSRINGWEKLPDTNVSIGVIESVIDLLCRVPGIHFAIRGVNVLGQKSRNYPSIWSPRRVGIQYVLEKCDEYVKTPGSLMVIVDDMAKPDEHRELLKLYRSSGTPGFRSSKLKSIIDNIYFMPSHYARGIQAADILAYVHRRHHTMTESTDPRAREVSHRIWGKLEDSGKLRSYGVWPN
jgi:hypothetical protein